jgi:hypothetical protein
MHAASFCDVNLSVNMPDALSRIQLSEALPRRIIQSGDDNAVFAQTDNALKASIVCLKAVRFGALASGQILQS